MRIRIFENNREMGMGKLVDGVLQGFSVTLGYSQQMHDEASKAHENAIAVGEESVTMVTYRWTWRISKARD